MDNHSDPLRKIPTKHAPAATADIGSALKAARTKKGHTLEAVAQQTRIPKKFLDALENNSFDAFPALAYLRGFLKSYCDYLELDFDPLWQQVTAEPAPAKEPTPAPAPVAAKPAPAPAPAPAPKPVAAPIAKAPERKAEAPKPVEKKPEPKPQPKKEAPKVTKPAPATTPHDGHGHGPAAPSNTGPVGPVMLALVLGLLGSIAFFASTSRVPAPPAPAATPAALAPAKVPAEATLVLEFRDEAWLSVTVEGKRAFEGKAPKGARQEWKSAKPIELNLPHPEAVKATLNGADYKLAPDAAGTIRVEAQ